ncbi:helix-turn-helix transcriptional regulator [Dechloromonas denitrificans]|uniref:helix-turn-helix transcriptional regulator n=1 Tax=Dechloromonas denitrificans TaxID=281362 RepID=UPI001CF87E18|nr:helix-turn-helix domain-containing protein [Dechloromonas denitrificans]UCV02323.1 helix-turn-helix transcriptional regulator [Dechloromonas denitrificans]
MSTSHIDEIVSFRARLIEERKRLGFSNQTEFAHQIGISGKTYNHYETGRSEPGLTELMKIGEKGADLCYLMTGRRTALHEQTVKAHAQHVLALVDTIVAAELDQEEAEIIGALARRLGS